MFICTKSSCSYIISTNHTHIIKNGGAVVPPQVLHHYIAERSRVLFNLNYLSPTVLNFNTLLKHLALEMLEGESFKQGGSILWSLRIVHSGIFACSEIFPAGSACFSQVSHNVTLDEGSIKSDQETGDEQTFSEVCTCMCMRVIISGR